MSTNDAPVQENRDVVLCAALLTGQTYEGAAEAAGCSRATVTRRMADAGFRARLDGLRREAFERVVDRLAAHALGAVETLADIHANESVAPSVRVRAATALLDAGVKYRTAVEIDTRMAAIENTLNLRRNP